MGKKSGLSRPGHYNEVALLPRWPQSEVSLYVNNTIHSKYTIKPKNVKLNHLQPYPINKKKQIYMRMFSLQKKNSGMSIIRTNLG